MSNSLRLPVLAAAVAIAATAGLLSPSHAADSERTITGDYLFQYLIGPDDDGSTEVCEVRPDCNVILKRERGERFITVNVTEASGAPTPFEILDHTGEEILGTYCGMAENFKLAGPTVRLHFVNPNACGRSTVGSYSVAFSKKPIRAATP